MSTWTPVAAVTASHCTPHLSPAGTTSPQTEVTITGTDELHVHLATLGPEGDEPAARMTATEARELAAALRKAAAVVERAQ